MAYAHCRDRREGKGNHEHIHGLYKSTEASFFSFLFYLVCLNGDPSLLGPVKM